MSDLAGRTCVVTGATSGIGEETALALARLGAQVAIAGRSRERGEATRARIARESGNEQQVDLLLADLASPTGVRALAGEILRRYPRLHVLVNNAGLVNLTRTTTPDGYETTFAVNHLAPFLLTNLLLERLKESAPARIVNVSSNAHQFYGQLDLDDLQGEKRYGAMRAYAHSKLANLHFSFELAARLEGSGVAVNAVHPGAVATRLGKNNGLFARAVTRLLAPFFRTPAKGAETVVYAASAPELEGVSARYFVDCREARVARAARDRGVSRALWRRSCELCALPG